MTSFIEVMGVFVCGALFGAAVAIQLMETYGVLSTAASLAATAVAAPAAEEGEPQETARLTKKPRRTPWRKVKARYEAEHRRTRKSVEERVQEMERR